MNSLGIPTPESVFDEISSTLKNMQEKIDPWGAVVWEYNLSPSEMVEANQILKDHNIMPAEKIYIGKQIEQDEDTSYSDSAEIVSVNLQSGDFIEYYSLTRYDDDEEIEARKEIIIDQDRLALEALVNNIKAKDNLRNYKNEISRIGIQELFALSAIAKLVKNK